MKFILHHRLEVILNGAGIENTKAMKSLVIFNAKARTRLVTFGAKEN